MNMLLLSIKIIYITHMIHHLLVHTYIVYRDYYDERGDRMNIIGNSSMGPPHEGSIRRPIAP